MKFNKVFSDSLNHCYAIMRISKNDKDFVVVASEENEPCYAYDLNNNYKRINVWNDIGGTMTMIPIPGTLDFLATQKFYPGFNSADCRIVKESFNGKGWDQHVVGDFPYIHRFDLIQHGQGIWFIGCSIANSKKNTDDWSDPGKIFVGDYDDSTANISNYHALDIRLKKNHGYKNMNGYSLITAVEGIFKLSYPTLKRDWQLTQLSENETSDIISADTNGDGDNEYLAIEGFHGPYLRIYDHNFNSLYRTPADTPFGHALWAGSLGERQYFVFGFRSGLQNLELLSYGSDGKLTKQLIDKQVGPSNVTVFEKNGSKFLLSANREINEVAIYQISASKN
ncbi:hypothetical protein DLJ48_01540 [Oenococcus sicerae]|uniref:Uncharacterized protein n=1 Tax=Oenococcus sicerae TaxID=2203724 RepID=A0AAJ1VQW3_9LACO|nr:hypothetical protein [Oenococcus sicerae]MDN6900697.1 hypothetical protein [Oenococcus sicerae]QAS70588.1 hypothetical protein DLJ48_01540 [Oenococcus sicerae]